MTPISTAARLPSTKRGPSRAVAVDADPAVLAAADVLLAVNRAGNDLLRSHVAEIETDAKQASARARQTGKAAAESGAPPGIAAAQSVPACARQRRRRPGHRWYRA